MTKIMHKVNNLCKVIQTLAEPALEQIGQVQFLSYTIFSILYPVFLIRLPRLVTFQDLISVRLFSL